jgi:hypothetical protein
MDQPGGPCCVAVLLSRAKAGNGHETQVHIDAHAAQVHKHIYQVLSSFWNHALMVTLSDYNI